METLRNASTFQVDVRVRQSAVKLQDTALVAKLSAGDMIAQEAKYHTQCLVSLYNKAREVATFDQRDIDSEYHGIAYAGHILYIEDARMDSLVASDFKLTDLTNMYSNRLEQLGSGVAGHVHSTRLKERILAYFPDMEAHKQGRDVVLVCNKDVGSAIRKACERDVDNDAVHLAKAANIVRRDMFKLKRQFSSHHSRITILCSPGCT